MTDTLHRLRELRLLAEAELWEAQLKEWPDSKMVSLHEVYRTWLQETPSNLEAELAHWDGTLGKTYSEDEAWAKRNDRQFYVQQIISRHQIQLANNVVTALQFPAFVFYECGKKEDGSYKWRGCRYGTAPHEYMSGFGRY